MLILVTVKIEDGSIREIVDFVKKNKTTVSLIATVIAPFLNTGLEYYLNKDNLYKDLNNNQIVQVIKENKNLRKGLEKTLAPIKGDDNILVINTGDGEVNLSINLDEKNKIIKGIREDDEEAKINEEEKEETLHGIVSASKLYDIHPFNFRIQGTETDVPMQFNNLELDLEKRQEFLGKEIIAHAKVKYKNNKRILIEVEDYSLIENLFNQKNDNN